MTPYRSAVRRSQSRPNAHLARLLDEADARVDEERDAPDDLGHVLGGDLSRCLHRVEHAERGGERVRDLLHRCRAGLLEVVRAHVDRVPLRDVTHGVTDQVDGQTPRRLRPEDVGAAAQVLLDDVVLRRPGERVEGDALLVGERHVHAEEPHRRRVDRHRRVHLVERDAVEQDPHLAEVRDGDADLADLALGEDVVRVVAGLGREVEGDREPGLALGEVRPVQLVRRAGRGVARVRPHEPGAFPLGHVLLTPPVSPL